MIALAIALGAPAAAAVPPAPTRWVTDPTGQLSPPVARALDRRLEGFEDRSGHQVLLWIGPLGDEAPEVFSVRAFESWGVGRAGVDDGLVVFLFPDQREARVEVGYGLEPVVTDAQAGQVLREVMIPRLRLGDWDGAAVSGVDTLLRAIDPQAAEASTTAIPSEPGPAPPRELTVAEWVVIGVIAVGFLLLLIFRPRLALMLLWMLMRGGGHGGGGGGGFQGGGGRSGGGGAGGGW